MTRRRAVQTIAAATLLSLARWPGALRAATQPAPGEAFTFVVVNDTHYKSPECGMWLKQVVAAMQREKPAFCLHVGDIVDDGRRDHLATVRGIMAEIGVPVYVQIGNHDYDSETGRSAYEELFPDRLNYGFEHQGWQFLGVDSTEGRKWEGTMIAEASLQWVDRQLARLDRNRPLVLFTHFPLADGVQFQPGNASALLERFRDLNLQAVFNGHFHGYTDHAFQHARVTTNRCCALRVGNFDGTTEKGFFVCTAGPGGVTRRFVEVLPTPGLL